MTSAKIDELDAMKRYEMTNRPRRPGITTLLPIIDAFESPHGTWVRYEDAAALIRQQQAVIEASRKRRMAQAFAELVGYREEDEDDQAYATATCALAEATVAEDKAFAALDAATRSAAEQAAKEKP